MANLLINTTVGGNTVITTSNIGTYALTSITSGQVTTALGFTPYNATNPSGYITSYSETDTLASVTARGASTSTNSVFTGGLQARKAQTAGNYTTAALWTESYNTTTTGIAFHISGVVGKFLEMRTNGILYWEDQQVWTASTLTNLNQLTNGPGYQSASTAITTSNIGSQSVSNSNYINSTRDTPGSALQYWQAPSLGITEAPSADWHNTIRMGHGSPLSYYSNTLAVRMTGSGVGDIYTQTIMNGTAQGWKKHWNDGNDGVGSGLDADLLDGQQGSYYQAASSAITTSNIGSQSVSYATTAGALTSMNISQFTNNSNYVAYGNYSWTSPVFGQYGIKSNLIDNVLYSAADRFEVFKAGVAWNSNAPFNLNYDQNADIIPVNTSRTYSIVLNTKGNSASGITYTEGNIYLSFYHVYIPGSVSGRVRLQNGTWVNISGWTNVANNGSYAVWRGNVPTLNYMVEIEITINANSSNDTWFAQWEYVMGRPGQYELGIINKAQDNSLWRTLYFKDSSNVACVTINSGGISANTVTSNNFNVSNAIYFGAGNNYLNWTNGRIYSNVGIETASNLVVGGNSYLGNASGDETHINDILRVGATDSGDAHFYFGEGSLAGSDYGSHWHWDSGYRFTWNTRNAGTDTVLFYYDTNSLSYITWNRSHNINANSIDYVGQLHFNGGTRFNSYNSNYLYFQTDSTNNGGIIVRDGNASTRGYSGYFDSSGFGLLNSSGNWGIRLNPGNVGTELYHAGSLRLDTRSGGVGVNGNLYTDQNYGHGLVGLYASTRYQGVFAMGDSYKLTADGTGTGTLYGIAWTHTNVGGQSKSGLGHQALFMDNGVTQTAIGYGIWTNGLITTTSYGTSANWNTAYGWGNHASAGYLTSVTNISGNAGTVTNGVYTNSSSAISGDNHMTFGPNSTWSSYIRVGGNGRTVSGNAYASMVTTNGNLHLDAGDSRAIYLNYYAGTSGVAFGNGASGVVAWMGSDGDLWKGSSDNSGTQYVYNSGTWSINVTGNAATATALTSMNISQFTNNSGYLTGYTETDTLATVTSRGATTSGNITINGGILNTDLARIINPHGASYTAAPSSITGAWKIKLPAGSRLLYPMLQFTINIYTYSTGVVSQIRVGGHFSGASWHNIFAYGITDTAPQYTIRFGFDATDAMCVWVGELGTAWYYPSVFVTDFQNGYSAVQSSWASGWTITNVTAFDTVTNARSVALGLNTNNYNSYAPTLTGTGASGTWSINVTGSAGSISGFNNPATGATANTIVYRDSSGDIYGRYIFGSYHNSSDNVDTGSITYIMAKFGDNYHRSATAAKVQAFLGLGSLAYSSATIPTNNNQLTNGAGYITGISFAGVSSKPTTISGYGITDAITTGNIGSQSVSYATTAGSAPNAGNVNDFYNVTAGNGYGLRFWNSDNYKISMGASALYYYGPVTDYSIKMQMNDGDTGRGFTWGRISYAPIAALNSTSGDMEIAGYFKSYGYRSNSNVGGVGSASWHPDGIYCGSTMWQYGAQYKNNTGIYDVSEIKMYGGLYLQTYNDRNLIVKGNSSSDAGIEGRNAAGNNVFQIYGSGSDYGFLNGTWASWDIKKTKNAAMYMNNDSTYYLYTNSTSNFYALNIQGNAVVHAGNIGSQSVSYATTSGSVTGLTLTSSANNLNPDNVTQNQIGYNTSVSLFGQTDGGLYSSAYSSSWIHQIYGDFRTGQIAIRGKNSGSWQAWRVVLDSSNYTSYAPSLTGSGASGSWGISVTGSSASCSGNAATATTASNLAANTSPTIQVLNFTGVSTNSGNANQSYAIYQESGAWTHPFPDLCIGYHTGIKIGAYFGYNGIRFYNNSDMATETFSVGNGDNHVRVAYNLYVGGTVTGSNLSGTNTGDQTNISGNAATATNVAYSGLTGTVPTWNQNTTGTASNITAHTINQSVGTGNSPTFAGLANTGGWYSYNDDDRNPDSANHYPTTSARSFRFSFVGAGSVGGTGNYGGLLQFNPWDGTSASTGDSSYQLAFLNETGVNASGVPGLSLRNGINSTWNAWYRIITSGNIASQSVSYAATSGSATSATTAQQLTKFGDIYGQDWNSYFITGKLIVSNALGHTGTNRPINSYGYGTTLSYGETGGPLMQIYLPEDAGNTGGSYKALAFRSGYNGSWSSWKTVVDQVGNTCTVAGSNGTGLQVHSNVGYNQNPLTYFLLRGQADSSWKTFKILLTGDAGGQDIEFRRIAENSTDARMFYVPRGLNQVIFDYTVVQPSDSRLKDNLTPITNPVDKIKSLRGVEFDWNSGEHVGTHDVGLIAQDVEAVLPEAVTTQEDGYKNLAYTKVIPLLVEAMKEQQTMIEALRAEIELLKNK